MDYPSKKLLKKLLKKAQNKPHYFSHSLLLYNRWVLYFFVFLSAILILLFSATQNLLAVLVFFLTGFVVSFFTKNMIVVLFFSTLVSGIFGSLLILQMPYLGGNIFEGMENGNNRIDTSGNRVSDLIDSSGNITSTSDNKKTTKGENSMDDIIHRVAESNVMKNLFSDNEQVNKTVSSLLGQISGGSDLGEGDTHSQQVERLKLQSSILDKINQLEPFMNSLAKITETYNSYSPGK